MKNVLKTTVFIFLLGFTISVTAQDLTSPKQGAAVRIESYKTAVVAGSTVEADLFIVRAKGAKRAVFGGVKATAPEGFQVDFEKVMDDHYKMQVIVAPGVKVGTHLLVVDGTGRNSYRLTGTVYKINVEQSSGISITKN